MSRTLLPLLIGVVTVMAALVPVPATGTVAVAEAPVEVERLPVVQGVPRVGRVLKVRPGSWSERPGRVAYRWLRDGEPIPGAAGRRHRLTVADFGHRISVRATAHKRDHAPAVAVSRATRRVDHRVPVRRTVTYHVETRGRIVADLATFRRQAQQTLDDPRGWRAAGVKFRRVRKGGDLTLVLSEASRLPSFSSVCSVEWSCRVGRYVVINQTRWMRASPMWNAHHRSRRDYRHMVVNHETGHWLGHGHRGCPRRGALAPVMQTQSKGLAGCRPNPWPTASERRLPRFR